MTLESEHLRYPNRRYGMDHERYDWSMLQDRPKVSWPGRAQLALWVSIAVEVFPLDQQGRPFRPPGGMVTPYPDLRHYSLRDYGARVGVWRVLDLLERHGVRATWLVNGRALERYPYLLQALAARSGDEIAAHGWDMDHPHYGGQAGEEECELVNRTLSALSAAAGRAVHGWVSPGRSESMATPDLLAEAGVRWFGDWVNDDMPYVFRTSSGPLTAMPLTVELDDRQVLVEQRHSEADFVQQVCDQAAFLRREAESGGGRILSLSLHPWVIGQPHRIEALDAILGNLRASGGVWSATASEIDASWRAGIASPAP